MDTEFFRIARQDGTDVSGASVQEDHGLLAMASEEQRVNGACIGIPDYNPEAQSPKPLTHTLPHKRQRVISLRLEDGKAVLGCDTDVGFQHGVLIPRIGRAIQLPIADYALHRLIPNSNALHEDLLKTVLPVVGYYNSTAQKEDIIGQLIQKVRDEPKRPSAVHRTYWAHCKAELEKLEKL